jgi:hypothetical protein
MVTFLWAAFFYFVAVSIYDRFINKKNKKIGKNINGKK